MLDSKRLRILSEVARQGSFSAAADSLGYTQPAISRQIATLEAETGSTLMRRVPQGVVLTEAGRLLVARANTILAQLEDVEYELQALRGLSAGRVRMASISSAASSVVPLAVLKYRALHPGVELSMTMSEPIDALPKLRSGELDLALVHDSLSDDDGAQGIEWMHLFEDPMYIALPVAHPLVDAEPLSLAAFDQEQWMIGMPATCPDARLFQRACLDAGFRPRVALEHDDYTAVLGFVAGGMGVALVPEMVTRVVRADVVIRELTPALPARPIGVALASGDRSSAVSAMLETLEEVAEEWVAGRIEPADLQRPELAPLRA
jgi:DNA-binding transcriptional LysR family regulator